MRRGSSPRREGAVQLAGLEVLPLGEATDGQFERDLVSDPKPKAKSVLLTEEGARLAEELFIEMFGADDADLCLAGGGSSTVGRLAASLSSDARGR